MILLDSEGINAVTAEGQNDNQIFTLTVLLASVLIYNAKGVPKRNDLNDLKYLTFTVVCVVRDRLNNLSVVLRYIRVHRPSASSPLSALAPRSSRVYIFLLIRIFLFWQNILNNV